MPLERGQPAMESKYTEPGAVSTALHEAHTALNITAMYLSGKKLDKLGEAVLERIRAVSDLVLNTNAGWRQLPPVCRTQPPYNGQRVLLLEKPTGAIHIAAWDKIHGFLCMGLMINATHWQPLPDTRGVE